MSKQYLRGTRWAAALAVVACGVALVGAADEGAAIKVPVKAKVQFANGRTFTGTLLAVSDKDIEFQFARAGSRPVKYKLADVKAIQTADAVYVWNADKGRFETAKDKAPADKPAAVPKRAARRVPVNPDWRIVMAHGTGKTPAAAVAGARREAVRQVVVALVGGRVAYARQEKAIADKVLDGADGLIKAQGQLETSPADDGVQVRLVAVVDRKAVVKRLEGAGLKVNEGPRGTGTELPAEDEIKAHGAEVLADVLAELPLTLVADAQPAGEEEGNVLSVEIRLSADVEAYQHVVGRLLKVLDVIRRGKEQITVEARPVPGSAGHYRSAAGALKARPPEASQRATWQLFVMTATDGSAAKTQWEADLLGVNCQRSVMPLQGRLYAVLTALGPDGEVAGAILVPLAPENKRVFTEQSYRWLGVHVPPVRRIEQFFVSPLGVSPIQIQVNQALDYQVESRLRRNMSLPAGIRAEQVSAVACTLVLLPQ
jgi:hypothetical protein